MCEGTPRILISGSVPVPQGGATPIACLISSALSAGWGVRTLYRGGEGPVDTCNGNNMRNPLYEAFVAAGEEAGYGKTEDYNGYRQEGFGPMHMTVRRGERCSTDLAYLEPARKRSNLTVVTEAEVDTLILSDQRVTGVRYHRRGQACVANASREGDSECRINRLAHDFAALRDRARGGPRRGGSRGAARTSRCGRKLARSS